MAGEKSDGALPSAVWDSVLFAASESWKRYSGVRPAAAELQAIDSFRTRDPPAACNAAQLPGGLEVPCASAATQSDTSSGLFLAR